MNGSAKKLNIKVGDMGSSPTDSCPLSPASSISTTERHHTDSNRPRKLSGTLLVIWIHYESFLCVFNKIRYTLNIHLKWFSDESLSSWIPQSFSTIVWSMQRYRLCDCSSIEEASYIIGTMVCNNGVAIAIDAYYTHRQTHSYHYGYL